MSAVSTAAHHLVFSTTAHWELKIAGSAGQLAVDLRVRVQAVVDTTSFLLVKNHLQDLAAILLGAQPLANDLDRVHNIGQDSIVHCGQGSRTGSLLRLRRSGSVGSLWLGEDTARRKEDDVSVGELLLEFSGQSLLDLVEVLKQRNGHEDDDCALVVAHFEL